MRLFLLACLLLTAAALRAQVVDSADGYLITLHNDTLRQKIFLYYDCNISTDDHSFDRGLLTRDSAGNSASYSPAT